MLELIEQLDIQAVRNFYDTREGIHRELRRSLDGGNTHEYVQLALGISNHAGNYSASEHDVHMGHRILSRSSEQIVFDLAMEVDASDNRHLPETIYTQDVDYLKISVGSEMAMMLRPELRWVGNIRTYWTHVLVERGGNLADANQELADYNDDEESAFGYEIWRDLYLILQPYMDRLADLGAQVANRQGIAPGRFRYLWADVLASALFDKFSTPRRRRRKARR